MPKLWGKAVLLTVIILAFSACGSLYNLENKMIMSTKSKPAEGKAYLFGKATKSNVGYNKTILFKKKLENWIGEETIEVRLKVVTSANLQLENPSNYFFLEIDPGKYYNDFKLYIWNIIHWESIDSYDNQNLDDIFTVEANTVYYVGDFKDTEFSMNMDYAALFRRIFPKFENIEIRAGYNL